MNCKELQERLIRLRDKQFLYKIAKKEIDTLYASILYYLAMEQVPDRSITRNIFVEGINELNSAIGGLVDLPFYDIWKGKRTDEREVSNVSISVNADGISLVADDSANVFRMENSNMVKVNDLGKKTSNRIKQLLIKREKEYKGILGNGYQEFYVDKIMIKLQLALLGLDQNKVPLFIDSVKKYLERIKTYIIRGK